MVALNLRTERNDLNLQDFYNFSVDTSIKELVTERIVFTTKNEDLENMVSAKLITERPDYKVINLPTHGHFSTHDMGTNEFLELLEEILN